MVKGPPRLMTQDEKNYICEQIAAGRALTEMIAKNEINVESRTVYREMARDLSLIHISEPTRPY